MLLRGGYEEFERSHLSPYASLSAESKGRERPEDQCVFRTAFQRDRDRVIHSKAFRRLKHKTQVFISPEGDHYRTRLTHTLEVSQVARGTARALQLNEDLTEAIALAHDLGHTPFGHTGEEALTERLSGMGRGPFNHNEQSLKVIERIESHGKGLNLTWEVRDGVLKHTGPDEPLTLEGQIVRIADRIAYINHDIDDAIRAGILSMDELPPHAVAALGRSTSQRINALVLDIINESDGKPRITQSERVGGLMDELRTFLFDHVYIGSEAKKESDKAKGIILRMFDFYLDNPELVHQPLPGEEPVEGVLDYIAGMTDPYLIKQFERHFLPKAWMEV